MDFERMADGVFKAVQDHISKALAPFADRIKALEERQPERGEPGDKGEAGEPGKDGQDGVGISSATINKDGELELIFTNGGVKNLGRVVGQDGEKGADGKDGQDGKDGADGLPGKDGKDGEPGKDGNDGQDGRNGADGKDGQDAEPVEIGQDDIVRALKSDPAFLREIVADYLKENPPPAGKDGRDGIDGKDGDKGVDGKDGVGLTGAMIDKTGELIVTLSDGTLQRCGEVVGKDGAPGRDGADLSDVEFEYDGERSFTLKAKGGQVVRTYQMPVIIDKGYWREGCAADAGDAYTHDGSLWIAQRKTTARPSAQAKDDWRLAARKGRDGKPGRDANPKSDGPVGLNGDDDA